MRLATHHQVADYLMEPQLDQKFHLGPPGVFRQIADQVGDPERLQIEVQSAQ